MLTHTEIGIMGICMYQHNTGICVYEDDEEKKKTGEHIYTRP